MNFGMDFQGGDGGGGGGGGYTNNSNFGGGSQTATQPQKARRNYDEQTLIPVTISMAMRACPDVSSGDGNLMLEDGRKLHTVKIIGAVRTFNDHSTNVVYEVEDGTGLLDVKQWLDDNDCTALQELRQKTLKEHIYIKIIGQIKEYDGKKLIVANSVRPVSTGNEVTHHFLEVVHSAETYKRAESIVAPPTQPVSSGVGFGSAPVAQATGGGDSLKDKVLQYIRTSDDGSEAGANVTQCFKVLSNHPQAEIRQAIDALSEEGHIYSTISEDHYKFAV